MYMMYGLYDAEQMMTRILGIIYSQLPNSGIGSNNGIGWQMFKILIRV